jgi:hypothetical protein
MSFFFSFFNLVAIYSFHCTMIIQQAFNYPQAADEGEPRFQQQIHACSAGE